ncbi:uncharacterized protein PHACADRAFT_247631 [Phanerochaete carnosa HHB-10118-sp]|uniref:Tudor domain-containing protein n=1 Tax=Phanerochaete carnosa (strain HHB-10118-sp) TaxID=650164 RepID=K5WP03_PHACS|nr:uncharacterized protein PHACADRAFT_247631 [Phanerochaete carnosa HHB-10118-sp]EKM61185.1 hypothetical protein PHACADRAFT_247631 [Phanerochaete carnosa HHB-10118-sp]
MDKADLETYQAQLDQVELALQSDPSNTELSSLKAELQELIELTKAAIAQQEVAASSSKAETSRKAAHAAAAAAQTKAFVAGDDCLAKYSGDGQWYPARVASVGGSAENRQYSVVFKGYNTTELVNAAQIKPVPPGYVAPAPSAAGKRKLTVAEEEERERKKKKNEKKLEVKAQKAKEQTEKQQTWQKFAKKSEKKGIHIAGVAGTSIFKTPENPLGKVGVTGSGKGMTEVKLPGKHKFDPSLDQDA